jgi:hypothetical protein
MTSDINGLKANLRRWTFLLGGSSNYGWPKELLLGAV